MSGFKSLPKNHVPNYTKTLPLSGKKVKFRPYLSGEEKVLQIALESVRGVEEDAPEEEKRKAFEEVRDAIMHMITQCTYGKLDTETLPNTDVEFLLLQIRAKAVGETAKVVIGCEHCKDDDGEPTKNIINIDLTKIDIERDPEHTEKFWLNDSIGVKMRYPNAKMTETLGEKFGPKEMFEIIKSCIESIYTEDEVFPTEDADPDELDEFVNTLSRDQFQKISDFFNTIPTMKKPVEFHCIKCKEENKRVLSSLMDFFFYA